MDSWLKKEDEDSASKVTSSEAPSCSADIEAASFKDDDRIDSSGLNDIFVKKSDMFIKAESAMRAFKHASQHTSINHAHHNTSTSVDEKKKSRVSRRQDQVY